MDEATLAFRAVEVEAVLSRNNCNLLGKEEEEEEENACVVDTNNARSTKSTGILLEDVIFLGLFWVEVLTGCCCCWWLLPMIVKFKASVKRKKKKPNVPIPPNQNSTTPS